MSLNLSGRGTRRRSTEPVHASSIPEPGCAPVPECEIDWPTIDRLRAEAEREYALADGEQRDGEAWLASAAERRSRADGNMRAAATLEALGRERAAVPQVQIDTAPLYGAGVGAAFPFTVMVRGQDDETPQVVSRHVDRRDAEEFIASEQENYVPAQLFVSGTDNPTRTRYCVLMDDLHGTPQLLNSFPDREAAQRWADGHAFVYPQRLYVCGPDDPDAQPWAPQPGPETTPLPVIGAETRTFEVVR